MASPHYLRFARLLALGALAGCAPDNNDCFCTSAMDAGIANDASTVDAGPVLVTRTLAHTGSCMTNETAAGCQSRSRVDMTGPLPPPELAA